MSNSILFTVVIPQRNSTHTLKRLFDTIPNRPDIEIILVDNSDVPLTKSDVEIQRDYKLLWSPPQRFAGGARNVGIQAAKGKWLIFADADDYFSEDAFQIFDTYKNADSDIVYFSAGGIYPETGEWSGQADLYTNLVRDYLNNPSDNEMKLRLFFHVPWAKMIKTQFVIENGLLFDEVVANNDDYFSLTSGFYARKITADARMVYCYVVSMGSIMRRRSYEVMRTRLEVILRCNRFKKDHRLSQYQGSIMYFLSESRHYGLKAFFSFILMIIHYRQNPFVGCKNWFKTYRKVKVKDHKEKHYITD